MEFRCKKCNFTKYIEFEDYIECEWCGKKYPREYLDDDSIDKFYDIEDNERILINKMDNNESLENITDFLNSQELKDSYLFNLIKLFINRNNSIKFKTKIKKFKVNEFTKDSLIITINYLYSKSEPEYKTLIREMINEKDISHLFKNIMEDDSLNFDKIFEDKYEDKPSVSSTSCSNLKHTVIIEKEINEMDIINLFRNNKQEEAFNLLKNDKNSKKFNNLIYYYLSKYYNEPSSQNYNHNNALHYHKLAEDCNPSNNSEWNAECYYNLGLDYFKGFIVDKDIQKSIKYFEKGACYNDSKSYYYLGGIYYKGEIVPLDLNKATNYLEKSLSLGYYPASFFLGKIYLNKDPYKAISYLSIGKEHNEPFSIQFLGYIYYKGEYVEKDMCKAVELFKLGASLNNRDSLYSLGGCYLKGRVVNKDVNKAIECFEKAAKLGHLEAKSVLDDLKKLKH